MSATTFLEYLALENGRERLYPTTKAAIRGVVHERLFVAVVAANRQTGLLLNQPLQTAHRYGDVVRVGKPCPCCGRVTVHEVLTRTYPHQYAFRCDTSAAARTAQARFQRFLACQGAGHVAIDFPTALAAQGYFPHGMPGFVLTTNAVAERDIAEVFGAVPDTRWGLFSAEACKLLTDADHPLLSPCPPLHRLRHTPDC